MRAIETDYMSSNIPLMYLPLSVDGLLMPDVSIVAVCVAQSIRRQGQGPEWLVGELDWRGLSVPVIDFDRLNGQSQSNTPMTSEMSCRVAIVTAAADHGHLPYYAILISETPSVLIASDDEIKLHENRPRGRAEAVSVAVKQYTAGIPNIEWVEQHLLACILHC